MTDPRLTVELDDESVEWLIEAARHHTPGGMGHVADELTSALHDRHQGVSLPPPPAPMPLPVPPSPTELHSAIDTIAADVWDQAHGCGVTDAFNHRECPGNPYLQAI